MRFDEMAVFVRSAERHQPLLEEAFARAGIPAWYSRGVRRPEISGRAFLALLRCAAEDLSAARFAEYLSFGQMPAEEGDIAPDVAVGTHPVEGQRDQRAAALGAPLAGL